MASTNDDPRSVLHPGETIAEYLEANAWSQSDLARRAGITAKTIRELWTGKASITASTAIAFEKVLGRPAHFWLNLQRGYDEAQARLRELELAESWSEWVRRFPVKEMARLGWLQRGESPATDAASLLRFFGAASPESWQTVWNSAGAAFRQTRSFKKSDEAIAAWVRATELAANELSVAELNRDRLLSSLEQLRRLTRTPADRIIEPAQSLCAAAGVALVWIPELPRTGISGCARLLSPKKALIALTLRYRTDDQMWFTFFHEVGHVLLHITKNSFVLDNPEDDVSDRIVDPEMQRIEDEANRFAADTLIPPPALARFLHARQFTNAAIHDFSESIGVGPGIVVGRLQHEGVLAAHQGNALKQRLALKVAVD